MLLEIDPKVDFAFKWLFGQERNAEILIDLIDAVLKPDEPDRIREVVILNPFNAKDALDDKLSILDIKARDGHGRQHNVEMQMLATPPLRKRIFYYVARFHQDQLREGQDYSELKPTLCICLVNDVVFAKQPNYHSHFRLVDVGTGVVLTDDIEIRMIELPKFVKRLDDLKEPLDYWLY